MKKAPSLWKLKELHAYCHFGIQTEVNGKWVPARPLGYYSLWSRLAKAWTVFVGKADAVVWPEDDSAEETR